MKQKNQPYKKIPFRYLIGVVPMNVAKLQHAGKVSEVVSELKKLD